MSRRAFVATSALTAAASGFTFFGYDTPARAQDVLPKFPDGISVRKAVFRSWDGAIVTDELWTAVARSADDVVELCNWAVPAGHTIRPVGHRHTWSPLAVAPGATQSHRILLIDTTALAGMEMVGGDRVRVQAGASMESLLGFLSGHGRGVISAPAPGDVTVGGVLAVGGHGTAVPSLEEGVGEGHSFGSMSNLVASLTAVVWDSADGRYSVRTFRRDEDDSAAFLAHLGRAFLVEVELVTVTEQFLRCRNFTDITTDELFAPSESAGPRALTSLIDDAGRVGVIWYCFTDRPWVQVWSPSPTRPPASREVGTPFNYTFADNLPDPVPQLLAAVIEGNSDVTPAFGAAVLAATSAGLDVTGARDMWGSAKNFQHFVRPTTLRVTAGSHAIITTRAQVQAVVHDFTTFVSDLLDRYRSRGRFPINSGVEIRVTGLDRPEHTGIPGAVAPALSATAPIRNHPEWDTAVWLDTLTLPGTPHQGEFYQDLEREFFARFPADRGLVRPEWSKRWGHTAEGAWTDTDSFRRSIPRSFDDWDSAAAVLNRYDPKRVFTSPLLDQLFP